jgi:hypothetical protein
MAHTQQHIKDTLTESLLRYRRVRDAMATNLRPFEPVEEQVINEMDDDLERLEGAIHQVTERANPIQRVLPNRIR